VHFLSLRTCVSFLCSICCFIADDSLHRFWVPQMFC
jgi:hypothetical protein